MKIGAVGCGLVGVTSAYALVMSGVGRETVLVDVLLRDQQRDGFCRSTDIPGEAIQSRDLE